MEDATGRPTYEPEPGTVIPSEQTPRFSAFQRLWMAFTSPSEVFADIQIKPTWVLCIVMMIVLGVVVQFLAPLVFRKR